MLRENGNRGRRSWRRSAEPAHRAAIKRWPLRGRAELALDHPPSQIVLANARLEIARRKRRPNALPQSEPETKAA